MTAPEPYPTEYQPYEVGQRVNIKFAGEANSGFIAKDLSNEDMWLIKLDYSFDKINPGSRWLKVGKQFAHQVMNVDR